jgi:hypothetical protein
MSTLVTRRNCPRFLESLDCRCGSRDPVPRQDERRGFQRPSSARRDAHGRETAAHGSTLPWLAPRVDLATVPRATVIRRLGSGGGMPTKIRECAVRSCVPFPFRASRHFADRMPGWLRNARCHRPLSHDHLVDANFNGGAGRGRGTAQRPASRSRRSVSLPCGVSRSMSP